MLTGVIYGLLTAIGLTIIPIPTAVFFLVITPLLVSQPTDFTLAYLISIGLGQPSLDVIAVNLNNKSVLIDRIPLAKSRGISLYVCCYCGGITCACLTSWMLMPFALSLSAGIILPLLAIFAMIYQAATKYDPKHPISTNPLMLIPIGLLMTFTLQTSLWSNSHVMIPITVLLNGLVLYPQLFSNKKPPTTLLNANLHNLKVENVIGSTLGTLIPTVQLALNSDLFRPQEKNITEEAFIRGFIISLSIIFSTLKITGGYSILTSELLKYADNFNNNIFLLIAITAGLITITFPIIGYLITFIPTINNKYFYLFGSLLPIFYTDVPYVFIGFTILWFLIGKYYKGLEGLAIPYTLSAFGIRVTR